MNVAEEDKTMDPLVMTSVTGEIHVGIDVGFMKVELVATDVMQDGSSETTITLMLIKHAALVAVEGIIMMMIWLQLSR